MKKYAKFFRYLRDYKPQVTIYTITSLLAIIFGLFSFVMLKPVLDVLFFGAQKPAIHGHGLMDTLTQEFYTIVLRYNPLTTLIYAVVIVFVSTVLKNLFLYLAIYVLNPVRNAILRRLRDELFTKTLSLPIGFFTEENKGDLISRMTNDINELESSIFSVMEVFIRDPLTIIFTFAIMISISWQLTLFLLLFLPLSGLLIGRIGRTLKKSSNTLQEQMGAMLSVLDETLAGIRIIKAFNAEKSQHLRFAHINNVIYRIRNKIQARRELGSPLSESLGVLVVSIIMVYGGMLIFSKHTSLTPAAFITYITLFYTIITPFKNLSSAYYNVQKGSAALDRIDHLLMVENTIQDLPDAKHIQSFENSIEFKNVYFSYGEKKILENINLKIEKGKTIALVGSSGAGKSTMADLVPRFHDVTGGAILIDGLDVKECKIQDLRRLIGVVSQEAILFNDTIYNNIILGTGGATQERVEEAARIAHADDFILQKGDGYQTTVGDRGSRLSGGERQRITIARAVLKNPPILILDEATSSLDTQSERIVQDAINKLMENRTCIVIAHRLSTVQHADEIIVLDKGKIMERGTHATLMGQQGIYKKLVEMQQVK